MVNVAVICVALATVVLLTVIPAPPTPMVAPATKFVPASVIATPCPCTPLFGLIEVSVGGSRSLWAVLLHPDETMLSTNAIPRIRAHNLLALYLFTCVH
jgi:hypothetical protein